MDDGRSDHGLSIKNAGFELKLFLEGHCSKLYEIHRLAYPELCAEVYP